MIVMSQRVMWWPPSNGHHLDIDCAYAGGPPEDGEPPPFPTGEVYVVIFEKLDDYYVEELAATVGAGAPLVDGH